MDNLTRKQIRSLHLALQLEIDRAEWNKGALGIDPVYVETLRETKRRLLKTIGSLSDY